MTLLQVVRVAAQVGEARGLGQLSLQSFRPPQSRDPTQKAPMATLSSRCHPHKDVSRVLEGPGPLVAAEVTTLGPSALPRIKRLRLSCGVARRAAKRPAESSRTPSTTRSSAARSEPVLGEAATSGRSSYSVCQLASARDHELPHNSRRPVLCFSRIRAVV